MLGDAYFQLRAQVGTGLFSLIRLAADAGAQESTQAALRAAQSGLRDTFTVAALGPEGGGKSTLLNTLFERDFCGVIEPAATGKVAIFQYCDGPREVPISADVVELHLPQIFLRDFTIIEARSSLPADVVTPQVARADLIFFVLSAAAGLPDAWPFLLPFGRDVLKRLVFVVWQSTRVSPDECANAVKRLRQAMLKNLGQACPIFIGSAADRAAREKLGRWIESEVIFAEPRRTKLSEIDEAARAALREIVSKPRVERQALDRHREQLRRLRANLTEREVQSERQVAGALWMLGQSSEGLRRRGEALLREHLGPLALLWKRSFASQDFAQEIEVQARASLEVQLHDQLAVLETDLEESATDYLRESNQTLPGADAAKPPEFPRASLEEKLVALEPPLGVAQVVLDAFTRGARLLRWPMFAAIVAVAVAVGAAVAGRFSGALFALAGAVVVSVLLLAFLLRRNVIAAFGRHFAENRAAMLAALEPPLRAAAVSFYAALVPALDARAEELAGEGQRYEPLLARLQQIEETFSRIEADLRAGFTRSESSGEPPVSPSAESTAGE